jgi:hypothetical protein
LQVFFGLEQSPCSSASGRTDSGLAAGQSLAASRKLAGIEDDQPAWWVVSPLAEIEFCSIRASPRGRDEEQAPEKVGRLQEVWVDRMRPGAAVCMDLETCGYWQNTF